jgi:hypothetical protein
MKHGFISVDKLTLKTQVHMSKNVQAIRKELHNARIDTCCAAYQTRRIRPIFFDHTINTEIFFAIFSAFISLTPSMTSKKTSQEDCNHSCKHVTMYIHQCGALHPVVHGFQG